MEDLKALQTLSKRQRQAVYRRLTQLSYIQNKDHDRMASLRIRNQLMRDTFTEKNKSDNEKKPVVLKPSDHVPDALKNEA